MQPTAGVARRRAPNGPGCSDAPQRAAQSKGGVEGETNDAPRRPKPPPPRKRPGVLLDPELLDPEPQVFAERVAGPCSQEPSLSLPVLADRAAEVVDSSSLRFLTASALEARRKEEEEKEKEKEKKRLAVPEEAAVATDRARLVVEQAGKRRKRKKEEEEASSDVLTFLS